MVYSKAFMSFSLDKRVAMNFMERKIPSEQTVRVLYILKTEVSDNEEKALIYKNATNADLKDISFFEDEREILLFPFSIYEINEVQKKENYYIIYLNILAKYKTGLNINFQNQLDLIRTINQSNYIKMLQKNGLLTFDFDLSIIVVHFGYLGTSFSLVCKTTDNFSDIEKELFKEFPELKDKNVFYMCRGMLLKRSKTLEQNGIKDDDYILLYGMDYYDV